MRRRAGLVGESFGSLSGVQCDRIVEFGDEECFTQLLNMLHFLDGAEQDRRELHSSHGVACERRLPMSRSALVF